MKNQKTRYTSRRPKNKHSRDFLQFEKLRSAESYYENLQESNQKSLQHFQDIIRHTYITLISSVLLYGLTYLLALGALVAGLANQFSKQNGVDIWAVGSISVGLVLLIVLLRNDLLKNSLELVSNLARFNVVFTGYIRQIQQVDITFREMILSADEFNLEDMEIILGRVQLVVDSALDNINQLFEDFSVR